MLARSPGFTTIALLSLALGIGANTAIFTLLNTLELRPLPVRDPRQLTLLTTVSDSGESQGFSYPMYQQLESQQHSFSGLIAWTEALWSIEASGDLQPTPILQVSGNFFSVLGLHPLMGRMISPADGRPGSGNPATVAVIGYGFWQRRMAGEPNPVGKIIRVSNVPFTVIGVVPPSFMGLRVGETFDVALPLACIPLISRSRGVLDNRDSMWVQLMGRLQPGRDIAQARANLEAVWPPTLAAVIPAGHSSEQTRRFLSRGIRIEPGANGVSYIRGQFSRPLYILMALVGMVLLIACVNVANLLLARASSRRKEFGVRVALGASRWRLVSQLFTESLLLSLAGAALGFVFAGWGARFLAGFVAAGSTYFALDVTPDSRVLAFTAGVAILTSLLFGLAPAFAATSAGPADALRSSGRSYTRAGFGRTLVVIQVALSLVLIAGASLFTQSLRNLRRLDPGFNPQGVLVMVLGNRPGGYAGGHLDSYRKQLLARLAALRGVRSAALSTIWPMSESAREETVSASGAAGTSSATKAQYVMVTPHYFETMETRLVRGREFGPQDDDGAPGVAILSEGLAERLFPGEDAVGKRVDFGSAPEHHGLRIAGVVQDAQYLNLRQKAPLAIYLSYFQEPSIATRYPILVVRATGNPADLTTPVRRELQTLGREHPLYTNTLADRVDKAISQDRLIAVISAFFGVLGLLLAALGLYGLMAFLVARRTTEIGVRMALGAQPQEVLRQVLRGALALIALGLAFGIPLALVAGRLISGVLFGVSVTDPASMALSITVLILVGLLAGYVPARRASRVSPVTALRYE